MSYIGNQVENRVSPAYMREALVPNGSATYFDLVHDVPGYQAENLLVTVNNVIQEPVTSYTIINDGNSRPRRLNFGVALATTDTAYVIHRGSGELYHTPPANSVGTSQLQSNLKTGNVDSFTASGSQTAFTLSETPTDVQSIQVYVNGIYQKPTTNYTVSGTTLTLTSGALANDEVDVQHNTLRTTVTHVADSSVGTAQIADDAVTGAKIENSPTIAANLTVAGNLTVNGTTTTINSTTLTVDDKNIELAHSPSGSEGNDAAVDGGGITLKSSDSDKTILWENDTNQWNVNQKWTENAGSSAWHRPLTTMLGLG